MHDKGDFVDVIKNPEMGRLSWIIQVDPMYSSESLKEEKLFQPKSQRTRGLEHEEVLTPHCSF